MAKTKYQWRSETLKQRARYCQWATLALGFIGIISLFTGLIILFIVVCAGLLGVTIYASRLRKQDRMLKRGE